VADKSPWDESIVKEWMADEVKDLSKDESKVIRILERKMTEALDKGIIAREERRKLRPWNLDASAVGYCVRKAVLERVLPDEVDHTIDPDFKRMADVGNIIGDNRVRDLMQGGWTFIGEPEGIDEAYFLMGHADGLSSLRDAFQLEGLEVDENGDAILFNNTQWNPGDGIILEIKSVMDFSFKNIVRAAMPRDRDLIQSHIYAKMFDAKLVIHLVEKRSNGEQWVGAYPVCQKIMDFAFERAEYIWREIRSKHIPERPYIRSNWHCKELVEEAPDPSREGKKLKYPTGRGQFCNCWKVCQRMNSTGGFIKPKDDYEVSAWKE